MSNGKYREWLTENGQLLLRQWARQGLTDEQIAHNMGIAVSTLYEWKKKYSEISESLKKKKAVADAQVENALYKSALGYYASEEKKEPRYNKQTHETEMITTKIVEKWKAPSVAAQIFWLKNREPNLWRDKVIIGAEAEENDAHGVLILPEQELKGEEEDENEI